MPDSKSKLIKPKPVVSNKENPIINPTIINQEPQVVDSKVIECKAALKNLGINSLSDLGTLNISGNVIPRVGLLKPSILNAPNVPNKAIMVSGTAFNWAKKSFEKIVVESALLPAETLGFFQGSGQNPGKEPIVRTPISVSDAYWVATSINIANNTNIVIQAPNTHLVIIAQDITVGTNVTFSYERPVLGPPVTPLKPPAPGQSNGDGYPGTTGTKGNPGFKGDDAPSIEIWALTFTGQLNVDLSGQNGHPGGTGGDGGNGGQGTHGKNSEPAKISCKSGPSSGNPGGKGGKAGDGGNGGNGGNGGIFTLYAPQNTINGITSSGFVINLNPGAGGPQGGPGKPGAGGPGGYRGTITGYCANSFFNWSDRIDGPAGPTGDIGNIGDPGLPGIIPTGNVIHLNPISATDFINELLKPAIINFSKIVGTTPTLVTRAIVGDTITVNGLNFTPNDVVLIDSVQATTTYVNNNALTFTIPSILGAARDVQVKQTDGTLSNLASLYIKPVLTVPATPVRVRPGNILTLKGTGFMNGTRVLLNNSQYMSQVTFIDKETLSFTVVRPSGITPNSAGEVSSVVVSNPANELSNTIFIVLDTFKMLCFGDSIIWGQGLEEQHKFQWSVMNAISQANANIGVYKENAAHSGAIIGKGVNNNTSPLNGEVPTSFPTIFKQHSVYKNKPDAAYIDLVLLDGGINDLEIMTFLTPNITNQSAANTTIINKAHQYCFLDMKDLLTDIASSYPVAKIIVTGYYAPVTANSFNNKLWIKAYLLFLGVTFAPNHLAQGGVLTAAAENSIVGQSKLAASEMNKNLIKAVNAVNNALLPSPPRIFFADPQFKDDNAVFAQNQWLFALNPDFSLQDEVIGDRKSICDIDPGPNDTTFCRIASCGHPNAAGANAYFNAILPFL